MKQIWKEGFDPPRCHECRRANGSFHSQLCPYFKDGEEHIKLEHCRSGYTLAKELESPCPHCARYREALEAIANYRGQCLLGPSEGMGINAKLYQEGSYATFNKCADIAIAALTDTATDAALAKGEQG